jgi:alpha-1,2-mannosyltransferase
LAVYAALSEQVSTRSDRSLVCTCGEWYRFPSSFYVPQGSELAFLPSSFHGQLPQAFSVHGSRPESQAVLQPFNDHNLEQPERYEQDPKNCEWIIDLQSSECAQSVSKQEILLVPFLDAERTSALHRILYLPYLHEKAVANGQVHYHNYALYRVEGGSV